MTWTESSLETQRLVRRWELIALAFLLVGVGFLSVGLRGHASSPSTLTGSNGEEQVVPGVSGSGQGDDGGQPAVGGPDGGGRPGSAGPGSVGPGGTQPTPDSDPSEEPSAAPVRIRIPAIGVQADVTKLGLNSDSTVEVPSNPDKTGWYRLGPTPGQVGSSVILGHVDSMQGPAVFISLQYLTTGDRVVVRLADGTLAHFRVNKVATYPNEDFPAQKVYGPNGQASQLHLVTCGGDYDSSRGGYQANVVVYTTLIRTSLAHTGDFKA